MQITVNETPLHLVEHQEHEFLLSNKEVALGYGINITTLKRHKTEHSDELIENKHWLRLEVQTNGGKQKVIHWTKKGIVRLGFFIKSKEAKKFRDWAEDYIVNAVPGQTKQLTKETELCQLLDDYAPVAFKKLLMKNLNYIKDIADGKMCISDDVSMDLEKLIEQGIKYEKLHKQNNSPQRKELLKEIVKLNTENEKLTQQLANTLTPENIFNIVQDGLKYKELKRIAPLLT